MWTQALIIAYEQLRSYEHAEESKAMMGGGSHPNLKPARIRGRRRR